MKKTICLLLATTLILSLTGCGMVSDRVIAVEQTIETIGDVTLGSEDRIAEARKAYDRLPEKEKKNVSNARKLVAAEEELQDLKDNRTVTELIDAIWELRDITPDSADRIEALQAQLDSLPEKLRLRVINSGRLLDAREVLGVSETIGNLSGILPGLKELPGRLQENAKDSLADIPDILATAKEQIDIAQTASDALGQEQRRMLGNSGVLEEAAGCYQAALYQMAEKYFGEWEMESALELYRQFPENYKETAGRITAAENFLNWETSKAEAAGKWVWDGEMAVGADGRAFRADFPELSIRELEPDDSFIGIRCRDRRLLYVEIVTTSPKKAEMKQTVLNGLHELRPKSFTAVNIDSFLYLDDHLENSRAVYSGDIPTETGPWDGIRLVLFSGIHTHGTSGGSSWDHLLQMKIILQDDGRLRLEYYVRERDKVTDPNASPAMAETLVFFYDRK